MLLMNSRDKAQQLTKTITKSLYDLLEVLGDIDEDNPENADNELTITDDDGGTIILAYKPQIKQLTITRDGLKLVVDDAKLRHVIRLVKKKSA